jgi:hypothetical protein
MLPGAVREYKIEKAPFLTRFLLLEHFVARRPNSGSVIQVMLALECHATVGHELL